MIDIVKGIRNIIGNETLRIEVYFDEIVFSLYDREIPIVYNRDSNEISIKFDYCEEESLEDFEQWSLDMVGEISMVMDYLEGNKDILVGW